MNKKKILIVSASVMFTVLAILFFSVEKEQTYEEEIMAYCNIPEGEARHQARMSIQNETHYIDNDICEWITISERIDICEWRGGIISDDLVCYENKDNLIDQ